jgi:NAD(P)-dependent dehydrogenase (short-subunit alcohol dehydrogenase family)
VATVFIIGASRGTGLATVKAGFGRDPVRALARSAWRTPVDHRKLEKMTRQQLHAKGDRQKLMDLFRSLVLEKQRVAYYNSKNNLTTDSFRWWREAV